MTCTYNDLDLFNEANRKAQEEADATGIPQICGWESWSGEWTHWQYRGPLHQSSYELADSTIHEPNVIAVGG